MVGLNNTNSAMFADLAILLFQIDIMVCHMTDLEEFDYFLDDLHSDGS